VTLHRPHPLSDGKGAYRGRLLVVVVLTGVGAGVGGIVLTLLLHLVQHLAYGYTEQSFLTGVERASPARRVMVMALGGLTVGSGWYLLRRWTAPLQPLTELLARPAGPVRIRVASVDAALQIAAVGFGASLGREGAPRQVGAAFGGWLAERGGLTGDHRRTVLACGAGAGLAAVYNVPLGGALFTLEVLLHSARPRHVVPAGLTSAIATVVAWIALPNLPTYEVPDFGLSGPAVAFGVLVGPLAGGAGVLFLQLIRTARSSTATRWHLPIATTVVFAAVGAASAVYPQLLGNGKGLTQVAFDGSLGLPALAALVVLKPLVTAGCLSSGASGGLLTPSLATGAVLGALAGRLWSLLWPGTPIGVFALIAAAAVLATTLRAPICATVLVLEFTHSGPALILPMLLAVAAAATTAALLTPTADSRGPWQPARTGAVPDLRC
jgi:H+/Cl- antiporter ClcA